MKRFKTIVEYYDEDTGEKINNLEDYYITNYKQIKYNKEDENTIKKTITRGVKRTNQTKLKL